MLFETEEQIRDRISHRYHRWLLLFVQLFLTLPVGMFAMFLRNVFTPLRLDYLILPLWFASLGIHAMYLFVDAAKERAIRREIERQQRLSVGLGGKSKRSSRLSLGEDGELLDVSEFVNDQKDASTY